MKKQRFTEEQIIGGLREQEAGAKAADLCRKRGISEASHFRHEMQCIIAQLKIGLAARERN